MPYTIKFDHPPAGISVSAARDGEMVLVQQIEFTSTEDGQVFIDRLEGIVNDLLTTLRPQRTFRPSEVDHLLAIIEKDGKTTVYVNEIPQLVSIRINRPCQKGEAIARNDIVDFGKFCLTGIAIPEDAGILYLFSVGWRKGLFFDLSPIGPTVAVREYDCETLFGRLHGYVMFQERFAIAEDVWCKLFAFKWFPFAGIKNDLIGELLSYIRSNWNPDDLTDRICDDIKTKLTGFLDTWDKSGVFSPHMEIIRRAAERFLADDFISCSGLLYPRIEGLLRSHLMNVQPSSKVTQATLSESPIESLRNNFQSLLMPHKFQEYLASVYFASFNPNDTDIGISRNSVGHGVASPSEFSKKSALIAILVVQQLYYCIETAPMKTGLAIPTSKS